MTDHFDRSYWGDRIDLSRWGSECRRGPAYKQVGAPAIDGQAGAVRKISTGRKSRGMASDGWDHQHRTDGSRDAKN
jgi:hypothetical protein